MHTLKQWLESKLKSINSYPVLPYEDLITSLPEVEQMLLDLVGEDIEPNDGQWSITEKSVGKNQEKKRVRDIIKSFFNNK